MAKITPKSPKTTIVVKTRATEANKTRPGKWWKAASKAERGNTVIATAMFLKENQSFRYRQAAMWARLYGNAPLLGATGTNLSKIQTNNLLPNDRPTMNVVQSCIDTKVSRLIQSRPRPVFLTDGGNYKQQNLAEQLNSFIQGELYQTDAYRLGEQLLRDAEVFGTGCVKVYEDTRKRVALERVLFTELLVDPNDALYGAPRQLYQLKLVDRDVLADIFADQKSIVTQAEQSYPEAGDTSKTVSDQVMVVEGWHLPSGPDATDGKHIIACSSGVLLDEEYEKETFPFVFLHDTPRLLGFWGQGACERLMGTQTEINKLLITISRSINLVGVPRVFVEDGSKVVKAHLNNEIGAIVTYRGTKPAYEVAPCIPAEVYAQLQRLVEYAYQQEGVSSMSAASQKPSGLDSGEAIREYDDLQTDRFASLNKRYDSFFIDLADQIISKASDIARRDGKYETVYPSKDATQAVELPSPKQLENDAFVIQLMDSSSLPKDPAGRKQEVVDRMQAGLLSPEEGRELLDLPDLKATEKLKNAPKQRIMKILDAIVNDGKYTPPDPFMDLAQAKDLSVAYYNLYVGAKLEEERAEMLRTFNAQVLALTQEAQMAMQPQAQPGAPTAAPQPTPTNPMIPNGAQ